VPPPPDEPEIPTTNIPIPPVARQADSTAPEIPQPLVLPAWKAPPAPSIPQALPKWNYQSDLAESLLVTRARLRPWFLEAIETRTAMTRNLLLMDMFASNTLGEAEDCDALVVNWERDPNATLELPYRPGPPEYVIEHNRCIRSDKLDVKEYPVQKFEPNDATPDDLSFTAIFLDGNLVDRVGVKSAPGSHWTIANALKLASATGHAVAGLFDADWWTGSVYNNRHWNIIKSLNWEKKLDVPATMVDVYLRPSGRTISVERRKNMSNGEARYTEELWHAEIKRRDWIQKDGLFGGWTWKTTEEQFEFSMALVKDMLTAAGTPSASMLDMEELESRYSRLGAGASHISSSGDRFVFQNASKVALLMTAERVNSTVTAKLAKGFREGQHRL
jgi:hypothetical protein